MHEIGLPERHISVVKQISLSEEEVRALPASPLSEADYAGDRPDRVLALFVHFLAESEPKFLARGLCREEWLATVRDVTIWTKHLLLERGEIGLRETAWLSHLVRAEIFRLGRLQFVPRLSEEEVAFGGRIFPAGTMYCEVHIPAEGKLEAAEADASFARAKELFSPRFFSCDSWLLSPKLKKFLDSGNILAFASRFTVVKTDENDRSAERYIFGKIGDPKEYVAENAFSMRVKEAAGLGDCLGSALGYLLA